MFKYHQSIRQKIIFGYIAGVAVIVGLSLFTIMELWYIEKKVQFGEVISEFFDTTLEIRRFEKNFFLYHHKEDYQENIRYVTKALEILDRSQSEYRRLSVATQLDRVHKSLNDYKLLMEKFVLEGETHGEEYPKLELAIREKGKEIITVAEYVSKDERERLRLLLNKIQKVLIASFIFLSLLGTAIGLVLSKMVVKPLKSLEDRMREISEGKLKTVSIDSKDREIVSLTNAFNRMLTEIELRQKHLVQREKLASLGTLLSGVAHELNNPLSNISSSCQILMEEIEDSELEFKRDLLLQIDEQTDRAKTIVRSLLDFSREKEFSKERVSVRRLLEETLQLIKGEIPTGVEIILDIQEDLNINADKQRIQQSFLNLFKNAIESIRDEGKVMIRCRRHHVNEGIDERCQFRKSQGECAGECPLTTDTVDITIEDTGTGIPREALSKIFDPFFTTKDVGKGTGLGLYIVQEIIQDHDGCIAVCSEAGQGTTFLVRFPISEDERGGGM
jgi:signal transduction histidine kinase